MKKDIITLSVNIISIVMVFVLVVNFTPNIKNGIREFSKGVVYAFNPLPLAEKFTKAEDNKSDKTDNTNTTTREAQQVMRRITGKDSDLYSDIKDTPADIAKLMSNAEKTIKNEKVKGKTSEEAYFGGGTLVSFDGVEVQSKIPTSFYKLDIKSLLEQKADLNIKDKSKPTILVYHSHTTESYTLLDVGYYTKSLDLRSDDKSKNMVRVGDELCEYLERQGYGVIHDKKIHDTDYSGAYDHSRKTIEEYLEKYPSIEVTIDVHRDDITYDNKTKVKPTATVNGKKAARMMIIAGAEYGSVSNFPDWEYNLRFDMAIQNKVNEMYEGLMRPILFAERRYNMFETKNSFLLEIGTDANTLDEACYSARLFATALGELLDEEYTEK
ncbi:MAG: stage II sporulation protein P [Eubacterium sp.]|nr:stage II sporulation protein P [Eubacterium sp.]